MTKIIRNDNKLALHIMQLTVMTVNHILESKAVG